jgi:uncharacterized phiE125 gp8 family phage protein
MITIVVPATSIDLTTLAAVKDELRLTSSADDAKIGGYIEQASRAIVSYCNRVFAREEVEETYRLCDMQHSLTLARFPVASVSALVENDEELATGDYEIEADIGTLRRLRDDEPSRWYRGKIVVAYTAGFLLPGESGRNLPHDIERAAIMLVAHYYSTDAQSHSLRRETIDGIGSTERFAPSSSGLPIEVEALIERYRVVAI